MNTVWSRSTLLMKIIINSIQQKWSKSSSEEKNNTLKRNIYKFPYPVLVKLLCWRLYARCVFCILFVQPLP